MAAAVEILVYADRLNTRHGVARSLQGAPGIGRVECAATGDELVSRYVRSPADVVFVAVRPGEPSGPAAAATLLSVAPDAAVIMFGSPGTVAAASSALVPGVGGFLQNHDGLYPELTIAVTPHDIAPPAVERPHLSERELQILWGMAQGKRNLDIGADLALSEDSVKTHCKRIFRKLGVHDRAEAVAAGFRAGFLS
ncbi:response regulator transcription factor [Amycolatopsis roodepoortensis]|uniref:response regulator transcription factor n=1 Tax=Amycolatopsis roodepoortensis TaxID=700274 RepID=UPI00214B881D|nr:response regulator transcription factor [Amycolatopsis roodepoortensis]UUV35846.1 response regulator transcription factor [Amycolatopsis roodepoortensis]